MDAFGGLAGIGVLCGGLGFAYSQFKSGSNKAKDDLVQTLKDALEIEKAKVFQLNEEKNMLQKAYQEQINVLTMEVGKLKGLHEANERKIKEYTDILQGRSPEQKKFMKDTVSALGEIRKSLVRSNRTTNA